jgi:hypothetical protein
MSVLSAQQRERVDALLDELFSLPQERWAAELRSRTPDDAAVAAEVDSLIRAARASGSFLQSPAHLAADLMAPDDAIGVDLDGWRITRLIGRGGMGEVYEAVRTRGDFDQRVAVKLLRPESAACRYNASNPSGRSSQAWNMRASRVCMTAASPTTTARSW